MFFVGANSHAAALGGSLHSRVQRSGLDTHDQKLKHAWKKDENSRQDRAMIIGRTL
jgi:hypothetical protein